MLDKRLAAPATSAPYPRLRGQEKLVCRKLKKVLYRKALKQGLNEVSLHWFLLSFIIYKKKKLDTHFSCSYSISSVVIRQLHTQKRSKFFPNRGKEQKQICHFEDHLESVSTFLFLATEQIFSSRSKKFPFFNKLKKHDCTADKEF